MKKVTFFQKKTLKSANKIERVGSDKTGHWKITKESSINKYCN